jgi:hypothetical protein
MALLLLLFFFFVALLNQQMLGIFLFVCLDSKSFISLALIRPWEKDQPPARRVSMQAQVTA